MNREGKRFIERKEEEEEGKGRDAPNTCISQRDIAQIANSV